MKTSRTLAGAVLCLSCGLAQAAGLDSGWYLGAGLGHANFSNGDGAAAAAAAAAGTSVASVSKTDNGAYKLFAGYRLSQYLAAELGYAGLGKMSASFADGSNATVKAKGWQLNGLGIVPVGHDFELFGKLGTFRAQTTLDASSGANQSDKHWKTNYGVGASYSINPSFGVRGEVERYKNIGDAATTGRTDADLASVSAVYKF